VLVAQRLFSALFVYQRQHPLHLGFGHLAHIVENGNHSFEIGCKINGFSVSVKKSLLLLLKKPLVWIKKRID
jgi:hypothetical protein